MVSHASTVQPASVSRFAYPPAVSTTLPSRNGISRSGFANGARRATARTAWWDGASKLPGTCIAIHDPAAS